MNYCTLFNSQYLTRGLALYHSLSAKCKNFHLTIFAFDDETYQILQKLELAHVTVISLVDFESKALLAVKSSRTVAEYCWTCTPATILYCLEKLHYDEVCYLDADLYFWADPAILLKETQAASILITEHRYSKEYDNSASSGKYCVQFMYFRHDQHGLNALHWWRDACLEWCFNRVEEGKFGDQKYLDDWLQRFLRVKVLAHLGGGVAPWNVQQYDIAPHSEIALNLQDKKTAKSFELVFYHFHGLKFINHKIELGGYKLSSDIINKIYHPYVAELLNREKELIGDPRVSLLVKNLNIHGHANKPITIIDILRKLKNLCLNRYHVLNFTQGTNYGAYD